MGRLRRLDAGRNRKQTAADAAVNQVLEWNQIFIDTLITTNTANSSSQRLEQPRVSHAIFDAYNGIERRYTPIFLQGAAPRGSSRRAAVIAAAHRALVGLFPSRQQALDESYEASLAALSDEEDGGQSRERGIAWGSEVAQAVLDWRAADGFSAIRTRFDGGTETGQWRPTPPLFGPMSAQGLAFTDMFVLDDNRQFDPGAASGVEQCDVYGGLQHRQEARSRTGSTRTDDQVALAIFWEGNASVHWNQAANQMARDYHLPMSASNRLLAVLNIAMADTAFTTWAGKRFYGSILDRIAWRRSPQSRWRMSDGNPDTVADPGWLPLINTPSHPEYPAGHPSRERGGRDN